MLILALDTTSEKGGVGIFNNAECLASVPNQDPTNLFSVTVFQMAQQALAQAHLELSEIELYAVANGPGSFTGIRVGLAAAGAWGTGSGQRTGVIHRDSRGLGGCPGLGDGLRPARARRLHT